MADYQAVFFDAVGTLIHPDPPAGDVYLEVGRRFGCRHALDEIARRFSQAFQSEEAADREGGWRTGEERERRRWRNIVTHVFDDITDTGACFAELFTHFARPAAWRLDPALEPLAARLSRQGIVLGLASNYDARLHSVIYGFPILGRFRHVVISSEVGYRKPAAEFFHRLVALAGMPPSAILHVGDDRHNDYEAARALGLGAVLVEKETGLGSVLETFGEPGA